jgi:hypothetical protein
MNTATARADTSFNLDVIRPLELVQFPQFVAWRLERRGDKWTKVPINAATGNLASVTDPTSWCGLDQAASYARVHDFGIGFVFAADPFTGCDLDHCVDPGGTMAAWARAILKPVLLLRGNFPVRGAVWTAHRPIFSRGKPSLMRWWRRCGRPSRLSLYRAAIPCRRSTMAP